MWGLEDPALRSSRSWRNSMYGLKDITGMLSPIRYQEQDHCLRVAKSDPRNIKLGDSLRSWIIWCRSVCTFDISLHGR